MQEIIDKLSANVPHSPKEYIGKDGLTHCAVCNRATQTVVFIPMLNPPRKVVRCICDCRVKELEKAKQRDEQMERDKKRSVCFNKTNMARWTFEADDRRDERLSDAMLKYAEQFADFKREGKGLLLHGTVGTGKTFYAACIANYLIDRGHRVLMRNFSELTNQMQANFGAKQAIIDDLNRYALLILDDLGAERNTEYMQEMVFNIIDSRYRSGLPFIVTTNLSADEIKNPKDVASRRIYDRVIERCFPVEVSGRSRRREALKNTHADVKNRLGL